MSILGHFLYFSNPLLGAFLYSALLLLNATPSGAKIGYLQFACNKHVYMVVSTLRPEVTKHKGGKGFKAGQWQLIIAPVLNNGSLRLN